ncbi:MAG: hypothetical protein AAF466_04790 [Bacteroidota bacterium]
MNKTKRILLYAITIFVLIFTFVWNYYMVQWELANPERAENTVRVDTFVLWPLVLTLIALSLYQLFKKRE